MYAIHEDLTKFMTSRKLLIVLRKAAAKTVDKSSTCFILSNFPKIMLYMQ